MTVTIKWPSILRIPTPFKKEHYEIISTAIYLLCFLFVFFFANANATADGQLSDTGMSLKDSRQVHAERVREEENRIQSSEQGVAIIAIWCQE